MKKLLIAAVVFCAALASCQGSKSVKSFSDIDSLSYAIGMDIVLNSGVRGVQDSTLNVNALAQAFRDVWVGKEQMTREDAQAFISEWFQVREPARQKAESTAWLEEVKAGNSNIQTTASGLMYEIINPGDESVKALNDADQVVASYRGTLKDGTEFDKNDSIPFALNRVIPGWTEGMKLIGKGGEMVLWVPAELGYGASSRGLIPANAALKFEVKLLDVIPAAPTVE
jgi:FKBP-type peptidyl-prolyl cis-trans isomerase